MAEDKKLPVFCSQEPTEAMKTMLAEYKTKWTRNRLALIEQYHIADYDEEISIELSNVRRPLVLVRGRPISREQAMQLIVGEEPLFGKGSDDERSWFDPRSDRGVLKNIFYRQCYDWLSTWGYTDGTIGGNLIHLGKYPELEEFVPMYAHLAGKYPFLDMVVSYTLVDECCCFLCDKIDPEFGYDKQCTCKDCIPYLDKIKKYKEVYSVSDFEAFYYSYWETDHVRSDVGNLVCLTIWIHNGQANILFGDPAISKFNEYNTLYCAPEYAFYVQLFRLQRPAYMHLRQTVRRGLL